MKVSVVIPMFNAERTICLPLGTLLSQTLPAGLFELVLVDDGSTDRSNDVAVSFLEQAPFRWRLIRGEKAGVSAARNKGIQAAGGEHVFFLDSDDMLPPDFLSTVLEGVETKKADMAWIWKTENPKSLSALSLKKHPMNVHMTGLSCLEAFLREPKNAQVMIRKSFLDSSGIRYTEGLAYAEDFDFFVRLLLEAGTVHVEDRTFYLSRRHALQVTRTIDRLEARKITDRAFRRLFHYLKEKNAPEAIIFEMKRYEARARINLLREARKKGSEKSFNALLRTPETEEALRFALAGNLSMKWRFRAAVLSLGIG
jgi:glycosyltransferase involved in cell wall biosynthesis